MKESAVTILDAAGQPISDKAMVGSPFEAASRINRETATWSPSSRTRSVTSSPQLGLTWWTCAPKGSRRPL